MPEGISEEWNPLTASTEENVVNVMPNGNSRDKFPIPFIANQYSAPYAVCDKLGDLNCPYSSISNLGADVILPICEKLDETWCVAGLKIQDSNFKNAKLKFERQISGKTFPADPSYGLPRSGTTSLWSYLDAEGRKWNFGLAVDLYLTWRGNSTNPSFVSGLRGKIKSLKLISGQYIQPSKWINNEGGGFALSESTSGECKNAILFDDKICAISTIFPPDIKFSLDLRIPNYISTFYSGRLSDLNFKIAKLNDGSNQINIEASPILVPRLGVRVSDAIYKEITGATSRGSGSTSHGFADNRTDSVSFNVVEKIRSAAQDSASGYSSDWSFSTLPSNNNGTLGFVNTDGTVVLDYSNTCKLPKDEFLGAVATNAMIYYPGAPQFVDGEFIYKLAGMHYKPDKVTVQEGYMYMALSNNLMKCLYKTETIPKQVQISVTYEDTNNPQIILSSIKSAEGYSYFSTYGIRFSNPTLKIRLLSTKGEVITPSASPSASPTASPSASPTSGTVRITIKCVSKKQTRIIYGKNPKCPKGFKKVLLK